MAWCLKLLRYADVSVDNVDTTAISSKELVGSVLYDVTSPLVLMYINELEYLNRHEDIILLNTD